ncbi:hypothetical protein C5E07_04885 [Pseudoclavibacter sp. RFBJ3]|uniref:2-dehydropantoate 2-reductase n=1 Tax=unclassified Pseudoclavibacter TaxID=2615177 RepID=UPI000CE7578C|nr:MULTISPECIES: 2-dehydropantoate 2-reductase [unclassified Pseudoclavibacter]PPF84845.1 hypothetical protein C5C12_05590 [Pseudoclavibacter sp. RFBJ5]PPF93849.1 hypothetical protein C5E07_04885 [Pseudoclavibacter sp. RFBJ3]PPF98567.1 hypothetical protein C5C19_07870 [Pseudoclavibacter sp. RFBH5]PPG24474.1 hypothetical protein C5E13_07000 [Pseudoclavibacter sp. RFBI4]
MTTAGSDWFGTGEGENGMRVAVIGVGAVGGALALLLDRAGHEVVLTSRRSPVEPDSAEQAHARRLVLRGAFGEHSATFEQVSVLRGAFDLVLVAVKAQDTKHAVQPHLSMVAATTTVIVQNGLDGVSTLEQMLSVVPDEQRSGIVVGGLATFAVNRPAPDEIEATATGLLMLGAAPPEDTRELAATARSLETAVHCVVTGDLRSAQWSKLLINQVNAVPAVTGASVQETGLDGDLSAVLAASIGELLAVAAAEGAHLEALGPLDETLATLAASVPKDAEATIARNTRLAVELTAAFGATPNYASTLQSIRRGEATEIDALNGAVVAHGVAQGVPTPVNAALTSLVHGREQGQPSLSPAELRRTVLTSTVNDWFAREQRALAWRAPTTTPWGVLVSETMLQQTQAARVEPKWLDFMERWPTPGAMAEASEAEVLRFWDRLGYPRRALWLLACARAITAEHAGMVPSTRDALLALPGVGPYTASAVMSFAHGVPEPVVDTNVRRVLSRAFLGEETPWGPSAVRDAAEMLAVSPSETQAANLWNAASMELGALVCTAKRPNCEVCPIVATCAWFAAGRPPSSAVKKRQAKFAGSDREMRGLVLRELRAIPGGVEIEFLRSHLAPGGLDEARFERAISSLQNDGLIVRRAEAQIALAGD